MGCGGKGKRDDAEKEVLDEEDVNERMGVTRDGKKCKCGTPGCGGQTAPTCLRANHKSAQSARTASALVVDKLVTNAKLQM